MTVWEEALGAAIAGTRRRPAPVGDWLTGLGVQTPEGTEAQLLDAVAVLATGRAAAPVLGSGGPLPEPVEDPRPAFSERALRQAVSDDFLRNEFVGDAARLGLRAPATAIPYLLELASRRALPEGDVRAVTGPVGGMLAGLNPDWRWLFADPDPEPGDDPWLHPSPPVRLEWLAALRRTDPDRAREFVARTLAPRPEKPEFKAQVLGLLADPEQPDDGPLVEDALDARAEIVRAAARRVLGDRRLESPFQQRMVRRLEQWVRVTPTRRGLTVQVQAPAALDDADTRDGLADVQPRDLPGHLAARVPLAVWAGFGDPADIVAALAAEEERGVLAGLAHRTRTEGDRAWAHALFVAGYGSEAWGGTLVPQELADQRIRHLLDAAATGTERPARVPVPRINRNVMPHVAACLPRMHHYLVRPLLDQVTELPDPGPDLVTWLQQAQPHCPGVTGMHVDAAIRKLSLRLTLRDQLRARAPAAAHTVTDPNTPSRGEP